MHLNKALLFCLILIPFFGCRNAEKNYVNEINIGVIGAKRDKKDDSYLPTFKEYYKINLNTNKLLIVKNPAYNSKITKQTVSETAFNFSNNKRISGFIDFAKNHESINTFNILKAKSQITHTCWSPKLVYFEYNRKDYSKHYLFDLNNTYSIVYGLYSLAKQVSESGKFREPLSNIKINQDSLYANDSANIKIIGEPPPPPVQKTIKFTQAAKTK